MDSLDAYIAATGRNVTVLPPGQVFAYDWHRVRLYFGFLELEQQIQMDHPVQNPFPSWERCQLQTGTCARRQ
jgi:hypothetical protein